MALQSVNYFSERKQIVCFLVQGTEAAAVEINYVATLAQDLPAGLKAGRQLPLQGVRIFEVKQEKISRISDYS